MSDYNPIVSKLRQAARRLIAFKPVSSDQLLIYQVRRVRTEELLRHEYREMLGPMLKTAAASQEEEEFEVNAAIEARISQGEDPATVDRDGIRDGIRASRLTAKIGNSLNDPEQSREWLRQCEPFVMTAIETVGLAAPHITDPGVLPIESNPNDVCQNLEQDPTKPPQWMTPIRYIMDAPEGRRLDSHEMPLSEMTASERVALGLLVMQAIMDTKSVRPFRPGSDARPDGGPRV